MFCGQPFQLSAFLYLKRIFPLQCPLPSTPLYYTLSLHMLYFLYFPFLRPANLCIQHKVPFVSFRLLFFTRIIKPSNEGGNKP